MSDLWFYLRVFNFFFAFVIFMMMIYFGLYAELMRRQFGNVELSPFAVAVFGSVLTVIYSTGEVLYDDVTGGWRVFAVTILLIVIFVANIMETKRLTAHVHKQRDRAKRSELED